MGAFSHPLSHFRETRYIYPVIFKSYCVVNPFFAQIYPFHAINILRHDNKKRFTTCQVANCRINTTISKQVYRHCVKYILWWEYPCALSVVSNFKAHHLASRIVLLWISVPTLMAKQTSICMQDSGGIYSAPLQDSESFDARASTSICRESPYARFQ